MEKRKVKVLLIEDDASFSMMIQKMLTDFSRGEFHVQAAEKLLDGMRLLDDEPFDVVLLDLNLPDARGVESFSKLQSEFPEMPIVVLTGLTDEKQAVEIVQKGAQDYLIKGDIDYNLLSRSIRYAVERNRLMVSMKSFSLIDELTGLYNRRGFMEFAQQFIKLSMRKEKKLLVIFIDLDGLKKINDGFSHIDGDQALIDTADILKHTFRESDLKARIGGDEFAVLALEFSGDAPTILTRRIEENVKKHNQSGERKFQLAVSYGVSECSPDNPCTIDGLLLHADKLMYQHKRGKASQN